MSVISERRAAVLNDTGRLSDENWSLRAEQVIRIAEDEAHRWMQDELTRGVSNPTPSAVRIQATGASIYARHALKHLRSGKGLPGKPTAAHARRGITAEHCEHIDRIVLEVAALAAARHALDAIAALEHIAPHQLTQIAERAKAGAPRASEDSPLLELLDEQPEHKSA